MGAWYGSKATTGLCQPLVAGMPLHSTYRTFPRSALSRLERRTDCTFVVPKLIETMKFAKNLTLAQSRLPSKAFKY